MDWKELFSPLCCSFLPVCVFAAELSLTCRGLLGDDVGFGVRWKVGGLCVLARGQVRRHGRPRCHGRRGIPSHRRARIPGHHSAPTWLRDEDADERLDLQIFPSSLRIFLCVITESDSQCVHDLPRSLQPE